MRNRAPTSRRRSRRGRRANPEITGVGSIVCHEAGIVEAITWSMFCYLSSEGPGAEDWVREAVRRQSLPLVARVDIAGACAIEAS